MTIERTKTIMGKPSTTKGILAILLFAAFPLKADPVTVTVDHHGWWWQVFIPVSKDYFDIKCVDDKGGVTETKWTGDITLWQKAILTVDNVWIKNCNRIEVNVYYFDASWNWSRYTPPLRFYKVNADDQPQKLRAEAREPWAPASEWFFVRDFKNSVYLKTGLDEGNRPVFLEWVLE